MSEKYENATSIEQRSLNLNDPTFHVSCTLEHIVRGINSKYPSHTSSPKYVKHIGSHIRRLSALLDETPELEHILKLEWRKAFDELERKLGVKTDRTDLEKACRIFIDEVLKYRENSG